MKVPRVEDFDPKATPPLGSPMDDMPRIERPPALSSRPTESPVAVPAVQQGTDREDQNARKPASQQASMPVRQIASKPASPTASMPESQHAGSLIKVEQYLRLKGTDKTTFRYPKALIDLLADAQYEAKKRYGKKLTSNALAVAAMAWFLLDFEQRGKNSALYQVLLGDGNT